MPKTTKNEFFISGKVINVELPQRFSDKFSKSSVVLEIYAGQHRQEVPFEFVNDNMTRINGIQVGDWVNIDFVIRGRKHVNGNGVAKWYTTCEGNSCIKED